MLCLYYIYIYIHILSHMNIFSLCNVRRKCRKSLLRGEVSSPFSTSQLPTSLMAGRMLQKLITQREKGVRGQEDKRHSDNS
jgi:hypothetical protein